MPIQSQRKQIRLKDYHYSSPGWYYLTICTQNRQCLLGEIINDRMVLNQTGKIVDRIIKQLSNRYQNINLDIYQIMPNHIHIIIHITNNNNNVGAGYSRPKTTLGQIVAWFKYQSTKHINNINGLKNPTDNGSENPTPTGERKFTKIFQRNYYEHIIRNEEELNKVKQYIADNVVNWQEDENYRP
jgi:putative transposase